MPLIKLNQIELSIDNPTVSIWLSNVELSGYKKKKSLIFENVDYPNEWKQSDDIFYSFNSSDDAYQSTINLDENKYFLKPYLEFYLLSYFKSLGLIINKSFIDSLETWIPLSKKSNYHEFDRFSIKIVGVQSINRIRLLISYNSKTLICNKPLSEFPESSKYSRYVYSKQIFNRKTEAKYPSKSYPIINNALKKELNIPFEGSAKKNTYKEYYLKISHFYDKYLKGKIIAGNIHFHEDGFVNVDSKRVHKIQKVSNSLKFNNGSDYNVYNGLKNYGPYYAPDTENLRFFFIYSNDQREQANKLYSALKKGQGNFPGLFDYVKVKFTLAEENKIILNTEGHSLELKEKLSKYPFEEELKYFAIYLTKHKRFDDDEENDAEYYAIKYLLLEKGVLSQFIYYENIEQGSFNYHLPNISVAILAKIGGIPWKLDTFASDSLVVGFGVKKQEDKTFLGNTLCFKDDGIFFNFETYQRADISSLADALKDSIKTALIGESFKPSKLIIHFYKTLNEEEAKEIEFVLQSFKLNIPFIVLTINDSKSKDFLFFDVEYEGIMPISGTIIELKENTEFLIANNNRYNENQSYGINKYPFPIKVKLNKSKNSAYDVFDKRMLLDQVYSFSRIYWKSINQVSLPVTISYAKIVADLAAHFPEHSLPKIKVAHSNLWFL